MVQNMAYDVFNSQLHDLYILKEAGTKVIFSLRTEQSTKSVGNIRSLLMDNEVYFRNEYFSIYVRKQLT